MDTLIAYENHLGQRMEFGGGSESLHYLEHGLRSYKWEHSDLDGKVARFSRGMAEASFPVGIAAPDGATGIELRNAVAALVEPDVAAHSPGRFIVGDWSLDCYVIGCDPTAYWMDDRFCELDLTVLAERMEWIRSVEHRFSPGAGSAGGVGGEFPFDFKWEFRRPRTSEAVSNPGIAPAPFVWRVYGPAQSPYMIAGGNTYRVDCTVPDGSRLEVDSRAKTIKLVHADGSEESVFASRLRGSQGSGTYVFEPFAIGDTSITWNGSYKWDLVLHDVRSSPGWLA